MSTPTTVTNGNTNGHAVDKKAAREEMQAKRLADLEQETKRQAAIIKQHTREMEMMKKARDSLQCDYNKTASIKTQLEKLCRELQKQNRALSEESLTKLKEEEAKRKETQVAFQKQINDIMGMIKESKDSNEKLQEDKTKMAEHFKHLVDTTQAKQQEIEKFDQKMNLALKLNEAKLTKTQMEAALDKEKMLKERHDMLLELKTCRQELNELQSREKLLQDQLGVYTDKYQEFQSSFAKSNDVFATYKKEMEKMSKNILKLEKESLTWKIKFEKSNVALLDMAAEKQMRDQILHKTTRQFIQLQKLCRTFQAERLVLTAALTDNNIEIPPMPELPDEAPVLPEIPALPPRDETKMNTLTKNCADLKKNLADLQSQLGNASLAETTVGESPKKGKDKKNNNKKKPKKNGQAGDQSSEPVSSENGNTPTTTTLDSVEASSVPASATEETPSSPTTTTTETPATEA